MIITSIVIIIYIFIYNNNNHKNKNNKNIYIQNNNNNNNSNNSNKYIYILIYIYTLREMIFKLKLPFRADFPSPCLSSRDSISLNDVNHVFADCILLLRHLHDGGRFAAAEHAHCHPHGCLWAGLVSRAFCCMVQVDGEPAH